MLNEEGVVHMAVDAAVYTDGVLLLDWHIGCTDCRPSRLLHSSGCDGNECDYSEDLLH